MKRAKVVVAGVLCAAALLAGGIVLQPAIAQQEAEEQASKLAIVWTSGDRDVALKMVFMYALNAKRREWVDEVQIIVWGPSAKLLSHDAELQEQVAAMQQVGVVFKACKACTDSYGVSEQLQTLGIEVKYMGVELTELVASNEWEMLTF